MIAYIKGTLVDLNPLYVIVETQGIGYQIFIPASLFQELPQLGQKVTLYTAFVIRENSQTLYGFIKPQEKEMFDTLTNIRGIGPKLSLSLIGHMPYGELQQAISSDDVKAISRIPGIGKKTAERLIVELRDRLPRLFPNVAAVSKPAPLPQNPVVQDALSALINLGYTQLTAQKAIEKTLEKESKDPDLATLITQALGNVK